MRGCSHPECQRDARNGVVFSCRFEGVAYVEECPRCYAPKHDGECKTWIKSEPRGREES